MGRAKVARKSTFIDMTAMCDVTFLLLSFFILTTKFKPDEIIAIQTPSSVATKPAPEKNVITMTLDKDGRAYLSFSEDIQDKSKEMIETINSQKNAGLSAGEVDALVKQGTIATPIASLKQQATIDKKDMGKLPGIPIKDSANNEMAMWLAAYNQVYLGEEHAPTFMFKGDNVAKFPEFKNILKALTVNNLFKFSMVTNPEAAPQGTELWRKQMLGESPKAGTEEAKQQAENDNNAQ